MAQEVNSARAGITRAGPEVAAHFGWRPVGRSEIPKRRFLFKSKSTCKDNARAVVVVGG